MSKSTSGRRNHSNGLQVIGAGLPRTSTSSLQEALHILGFTPCYHTITDLLPRAREHGSLWLKAMHTPEKAVRQEILAQIVKGYSAIVDGPGCFFVEDWVEMYPDAKVILGLRTSPQAWLDSVNGSMGKVFGNGVLYYTTYFVPEMHFGFAMNNLWDRQTKEKYGVGVRTTEFYALHREHVGRVIPADRLLEFKAADGWGPLCGFLGREVPDQEYPHRNDGKTANQLMKSFAVYGVGSWIALGLCVWGLAFGVRSAFSV